MKEWFEKNSPVDKEDLDRHDKWLCMMWPRLQLLKELLSDDGVIFISIDENEQHRLRMMMDEIFGENNFIANIIWQKKTNPQNDAKYFSDNHDFVLCYAKNKITKKDEKEEMIGWKRRLLPRTDKHNKPYKYDDNDGRGRWTPDNLSAKQYSPEYDYPIINPNTGEEHYPPRGSCWRIDEEKITQLIKENRIYFGKDGKGAPQPKRYLSKVQKGIVPLTLWLSSEVGNTGGARKLVKQIFSDHQSPFENPKAVGLLKKIFTIATNKEAIILDSFAGSGTTAHAVLALNKEDGGNRKFILVECEDYADTITAERVRRVIKGVPDVKDKELKEGLGGSFTYCTLGDPIEIEEMLTGNVLPSYTTMANYLLYTASGISVSENELKEKNPDGLFYQDEKTDYYLLYKPNIDYLQGNEGILNYERAKRIKDVKDGRKALVFGVGKYIGQRDLTEMGITFYQLTYKLHRTK